MGRGARRRTGLIAPVLAAMVAAACGDDGGTSGVDGDKSLDQLSPAEATDLCDWGASLLAQDEVTRFACYYAALVFNQDSDACEAMAQECIDEAEPIDPDDIECTFQDELPACASEVTVAEVEACARDALGILIDIAEDISCDSDPEEIDLLALEEPASCQAIEEKCPELFEDDDDEAETQGSRAKIQRWARGARQMARSGVSAAGP